MLADLTLTCNCSSWRLLEPRSLPQIKPKPWFKALRLACSLPAPPGLTVRPRASAFPSATGEEP